MVATRRLGQALLLLVPSMVTQSVVLNDAPTEVRALQLTRSFTLGASSLRAPLSPQDISQIQSTPPSNITTLEDTFWGSVPTPTMQTRGRGLHTMPQPLVLY